MNDIDFSLALPDDIIPNTYKLDMENKSLVLYTYVSKQTANELLKYYAIKEIKPNELAKYNNPWQLPLTFYEYKEIAKALAPKANTVLVAAQVNISIPQIFDEMNPFNKLKVTDYNVFMLRQKEKYNSREYIKYTVKNIDVIDKIQLY